MTVARPKSLAILSSASAGGAGIAARRLAQAMRDYAGIDTDFIDRQGIGEILPKDVAKQTSYSNRTVTDTHFTYEYPGFARGWVIEMLRQYDVLNMHWVSYLLSLGELDALSRTGKPMIFSAHDFNYLTGGCHYPAGCTRFEAGCHGCPQVDAGLIAPGCIARNHAIKRDILSRTNVHLSAPSAWLRDRAVTAGIVPAERAHVLRNPYAPIRPMQLDRSRDVLRIVLIADQLSEGRKQMLLALEALAQLMERRRAGDTAQPVKVDLVGQPDPALLAHLNSGQIPYRAHGRITEHSKLAWLFTRADLLLSCSTEDNWPNILVEAGAYGVVPVVGPGHGCEEFVRHYAFGQVASDYTPAGFADAIEQAIARWSADHCARSSAKIRAEHAPEQVARRFHDIIRLAQTSTPFAPPPPHVPPHLTRSTSHAVFSSH